MTYTQLPNRKADAYAVNLRLEPRELLLDSSPTACCWDVRGRRLLFSRDVWRFRVYEGTDDIYDPGVIDTEIVALPEAQLPLSSPAAGTVLLRLDRVPTTLIPRDAWPAFISLRHVEVLAADPETGNFIVYSHRDEVGPPYYTDVAAYSPSGGALGGTYHLSQPNDGTPRWSVPHAIVAGGWVYAIERNLTFEADPGPAAGQVVKRNIGTLGSLIFRWDPVDRYVYPHSVSLGDGVVWVGLTKVFDPGSFDPWQQSYIACLDKSALGSIFVSDLNFGIGADDETRYWLGDYQASGIANSGGLVLFDGAGDDEDGTPTFLASGMTPAGFDPIHPQMKLFRFALNPPGVHIADLGDAMPIPMSRTPHGLCGNTVGTLPEIRNL
jgi:hypothetical protein